MSGADPKQVPEPEVLIARERTKQVGIAGWTAGLSVFFGGGMLATNPTWPAAVGVAVLGAMVTIVCTAALRR